MLRLLNLEKRKTIIVILGFIFIFLCFNNSSAIETKKKYSSEIKKEIPSEIVKYIMKGYSVLAIEKGNLNLDEIDDYILVLSKNGEDSLSTYKKPIKRILIILKGRKDNTFSLVARNSNAIYYYGYDENFKDAFVEIKISNGKFFIEHYGGFQTRWNRTLIFSYSKKYNDWLLNEDKYYLWNATDPEEDEIEKILTSKDFGKISFSKFDIYKQNQRIFALLSK